MQLSDFVGKQITILIPHFDPKQYHRVILHGVEAGGIWIESQEFTNEVLGTHERAPKTLVLFVPYNQIAYAVGSISEPSLKRAFGL